MNVVVVAVVVLVMTSLENQLTQEKSRQVNVSVVGSSFAMMTEASCCVEVQQLRLNQVLISLTRLMVTMSWLILLALINLMLILRAHLNRLLQVAPTEIIIRDQFIEGKYYAVWPLISLL